MKQKLFTKPCACKATALALSALALSSAFVGCTDYCEFTEDQVMLAVKGEDYRDAFIERFGEPAENHDWGFKLLDPYFSGVDFTRAGANQNNVNVNRNQWCQRNTSGYDHSDNVLANTIKVPGWPNFDGYYYGNNGSSTFGGIYKHDFIFGKEDYVYGTGTETVTLPRAQGLQIQPCGDVTEYEINYVTTWFRTHKNPQKTPLHLTDFFIQNISQDNDQLFYNDFIDLGGNSMQQGLPAGYPKSNQTGADGKPRSPWWNGDNAKYVNDVVEERSNKRRTDVGEHIQVRHQENQLNSNENLNYSVDYLHFKSMDGNDYHQGFTPNEGWTHINNFNNGNSNFNPEDVEDKGFREIKYVQSSGTEDFACRSSMATQSQWIHDWVLVHLEWKETGADGKEYDRDGYYLGFDFSNTTGSSVIECDGFYSNWIVKISPAYFAKSDKTARVMCEDLGGTFDFDFNDVVFDAAYDATAGQDGQVVICLMASGGTLPIVVGHNTRYEAHFMLGEEDVTKPVNVAAANGVKRDVAIYRLDAADYITTTGGKKQLDVSKIPILVSYSGNDNYSDANDQQEIGKEAWTDTQYGQRYDKTASRVPRKFATAIGVNWMKELQFINEGYQKFIEWVKAPSTYDYDVDTTDPDAAGSNGGQTSLYWYDDTTDEDKIYEGPSDPVIHSSDPTINPVKWQSLATVQVTANFTLKEKAVDYITIKGYEGPNSVIKKLENLSDYAFVTFAYITKAAAGVQNLAAQTSVHGMIVPIWIIDGNPVYVRPDGTRTTLTETSLSRIEGYRTATWQSNFTRSGVNGSELPSTDMGQGVDKDGNYTFVTKYGYTKSDLYVDITPNDNIDNRVYCDYMAFYVFEDVSDDPYTTATHNPTQGVMNTDGDVKKYECYVIF